MRNPRTSLVGAALLTTVLSSGLLAGCDQVQDRAEQAAGDAACSIAQEAADGVRSAASSAADQIGADPEQARQTLEDLRGAVDTAEGRVSGDVKTQLGKVRDALDDLATEAKDAAAGQVDEQAVEQSKQDLADAVASVGDVC